MEINCPNPLIGSKKGAHQKDASKQSPRSRKGGKARSAEISNLEELIRSTPDVRAGKVRELRKKVKSGTYHIKGAKIAEKIIRENPPDEII